MKVLQICSKPPVPEVDGGCKAMNSITQGLLKEHVEVDVLCISTIKHPFIKEVLSQDYLQKTKIATVFVDTEIRVVNAFMNLFSKNSYNIERFFSLEFEEIIMQTLKTTHYDIVFLEGLYVTPYLESIKDVFSGKVIYRAHNIEYEIWRRNAIHEKNKIKKWYLRLLARRLKVYELSILNQIDAIAAISQKDKSELLEMGCTKRIEVFPFGINADNYKGCEVSGNSNFFHIGSMDWLPNQEGMKWFLDHVWDKVVSEFPQAQLNLAGKGMPDWMLNWKQKNVTILGQVDDAIQFINENDIMIVPLFSGSGMRIKVIEGMALGKTIIGTTIATEGIKYELDKNILIANSAQEYIEHMTHCLINREFPASIGNEAKKMIQTNYDNQLIVNNLVKFFKTITTR